LNSPDKLVLLAVGGLRDEPLLAEFAANLLALEFGGNAQVARAMRTADLHNVKLQKDKVK
jgi:hypothetical protein